MLFSGKKILGIWWAANLTKSWLLQAEIFEMQKNQVWASLLVLLPFTLNILGYVFRTIAACIFGWGIIVSWNCHLLCLYP
jgi:hypothetical protein